MFGLSAAVRVYFATEPADMRKSFDDLAALGSERLVLDPLSPTALEQANCAGTSAALRAYCVQETCLYPEASFRRFKRFESIRRNGSSGELSSVARGSSEPACPTLERGSKPETWLTRLREMMPWGLLRTQIPATTGLRPFFSNSLLPTAVSIYP
jgi:hypothetical protein